MAMMDKQYDFQVGNMATTREAPTYESALAVSYDDAIAVPSDSAMAVSYDGAVGVPYGAACAEIAKKDKRMYWIVKRTCDIFLSVIALVALSPFMLGIALAIVVDDPKAGPIFKQTRCGRHGKEFTLYKFRSMCAHAEEMLDSLLDQNEMTGPVFKIHDDPRITQVGRFIRKTSLDELPQLFNVLKGDMTIIGPRPPLPREVAKYTEDEWKRLWITPGLSCTWQATPNRNGCSFDEWVELDLKYLEERSLGLDAKLVCRTVGVVMKGEGI